MKLVELLDSDRWEDLPLGTDVLVSYNNVIVAGTVITAAEALDGDFVRNPTVAGADFGTLSEGRFIRLFIQDVTLWRSLEEIYTYNLELSTL